MAYQSLTLLTDVDLSTVSDQDVLTFNNSTGNWEAIAPSGGSVEFWSESYNDTAPNDTVPMVQWQAIGPDINIGAVLTPKGTGAISAHVPDNLVSGGAVRGDYAVDLQLSRQIVSQVASGAYSVLCGGDRNESSGDYAFVGGGQGSFALKLLEQIKDRMLALHQPVGRSRSQQIPLTGLLVFKSLEQRQKLLDGCLISTLLKSAIRNVHIKI